MEATAIRTFLGAFGAYNQIVVYQPIANDAYRTQSTMVVTENEMI
jgi:hypothetical protein